MAGRFRGGLCPACLVALALHAGENVPAEEADRASSHGGYRILTVLSGDDTRTTYLAEQEGSRSLVTLEVVRGTAAGVMAAQFEARLEAIRGLRHPRIARVLDGRVTAERDYCIVAEYVPGQPCDRCFQHVEMDAAAILRVFEHLCDAVGYAHARGVVHGRLRPSAVILITQAGSLVPRLTGFSLCERSADPADDVRGLGQIVTAMAGWAPLPAQLEEIVRRATEVDGGARFPTVEALREAVARGIRL